MDCDTEPCRGRTPFRFFASTSKLETLVPASSKAPSYFAATIDLTASSGRKRLLVSASSAHKIATDIEEHSIGGGVGEGVPLPRPRLQVVHGTVQQKCARNTLPGRSGMLPWRTSLRKPEKRLAKAGCYQMLSRRIADKIVIPIKSAS